MTSAGFEGSDPTAGGLAGAGGDGDPVGGPPGADVRPCLHIFSLERNLKYNNVNYSLNDNIAAVQYIPCIISYIIYKTP